MSARTVLGSTLGGVAGVFSGAPAWCLLPLGALALGCVAMRILIPQDSADKLAWWAERRAYRERKEQRRTGAAPPGPPPRPGTGGRTPRRGSPPRGSGQRASPPTVPPGRQQP